MRTAKIETTSLPVEIPIRNASLKGELRIPEQPRAVVLFAHGSGSSRLSPRNRFVAEALGQAGFATLLVDLLTHREEEEKDLRFDIPFLSRRLATVADWLKEREETADLPLGYFGASTGAAAALTLAARRPEDAFAVVSRGGRPDLAWNVLPQVRTPTLFIVGGNDAEVAALNEAAGRRLGAKHRLVLVSGATHLFEEAGALEEVAGLAADWFLEHLPR